MPFPIPHSPAPSHKPQATSHSAPGRLVVMSGPSGVGKSTIRNRVLEVSPVPLRLSISATTRQPRAGEENGVDYYFISHDEFRELIQDDGLLEYAEVFGKGTLYGTPRDEVDTCLSRGQWVLLEIDVDGAVQVMRHYPDAVTVFVMPENMAVLEARLRGRGTESEEVIAGRLARAEYEIGKSGLYQYTIINRTVEKAVEDFCKILVAESRK